MAKKIPEDIREEILWLRSEGLTPKQIHELYSEIDMEIPYVRIYELTRVREKGYGSMTQYREDLARKKGHGSLHKYREGRGKKKAELPQNRILAQMINNRLDRMGKSGAWLARETDLSKQTISFYRRGIKFPEEENLERVLSVLGLEREKKNLEALIEGKLKTSLDE